MLLQPQWPKHTVAAGHRRNTACLDLRNCKLVNQRNCTLFVNFTSGAVAGSVGSFCRGESVSRLVGFQSSRLVRKRSDRLAARRKTDDDTNSQNGNGTNGTNGDKLKAAKLLALQTAIKAINEKFGKGTIQHGLGGSELRVDTIPSGALTLDVALGGGYPRGRIVEVYGLESSGKTTLALHAIASVQKGGGMAAFIDAEHAFDAGYARRVGVDLSTLTFVQPDCGEDALEIVDMLIRSGGMELIVVDSVAALVPKAEVDQEIGHALIGAQARLMSQALRKLVMATANHNCTIMFINQLRMKVGVVFGNPEITSGGMALKFYTSVRIELRKKANIKLPKSEDMAGIRVKAKVVKSKVFSPGREAEFDIMFGWGISSLGCLMDTAEKMGVVTRKGPYYYYGDLRLGLGREACLKMLKDSPELMREIDFKTREALSSVHVNELFDENDDGEAGAVGLMDEVELLAVEDDGLAPLTVEGNGFPPLTVEDNGFAPVPDEELL